MGYWLIIFYGKRQILSTLSAVLSLVEVLSAVGGKVVVVVPGVVAAVALVVYFPVVGVDVGGASLVLVLRGRVLGELVVEVEVAIVVVVVVVVTVVAAVVGALR